MVRRLRKSPRSSGIARKAPPPFTRKSPSRHFAPSLGRGQSEEVPNEHPSRGPHAVCDGPTGTRHTARGAGGNARPVCIVPRTGAIVAYHHSVGAPLGNGTARRTARDLGPPAIDGQTICDLAQCLRSPN